MSIYEPPPTISRAIGLRTTTGAAETRQDVTNLDPETYPWPILPLASVEVVSTSADDGPAGDGIRSVVVQCVREDLGGVEEIEVATAGVGSTPVPGGPWARVNGFWANETGGNGNGVAGGVLEVREVGGFSAVLQRIPVGFNESLSGVWHVPTSHRVLIHSWSAGIADASKSASQTQFGLWTRPVSVVGPLYLGTAWTLADLSEEVTLEGTPYDSPNRMPFVIPGGTDVRVDCVGDTGLAVLAKMEVEVQGPPIPRTLLP